MSRIVGLVVQGAAQPGPGTGIGPLAISLGPGYGQSVGRFLNGEARVEPQLDQLGRGSIFGGLLKAEVRENLRPVCGAWARLAI